MNLMLRTSVFFSACLCMALAFAIPAASKAEPATLVFMTDFGLADDSIAICKGVMLGIEPGLRIVDLTHQVTPYSILDGARFLEGASPYFPAGSVFVGVVDPGVGSERKPVVIKTKKGQFFVVPDNGLTTLVIERDGLEEARQITNPAWTLPGSRSATFHGRDVFSPAAAHIAKGDDWREVGPVVAELVKLPIRRPSFADGQLKGEVIAIEAPYGNLITNLQANDFEKLEAKMGSLLMVQLGAKSLEIPYVYTFSAVPEGQPLLYLDSRGRVGIALNMGDFATTHAIRPPTDLVISHAKKGP